MYFLIFLLLVEYLSFIQASPIPDQVYDDNTEVCLSRREESGIFDSSETAPGNPLFANLDLQPLHYEVFNLAQDSGFSDEGPEGDLGFFSDDIAVLSLDTAPKDSSGQHKGACPADSNSLPSRLEILSPIPPNPYIPTCESEYPITLCCRGTPVPVPMSFANLGSQVLALPDLENSDGLVHVGDCIICEFSHGAV